jgi:hypothetical protein
MKDLTNFNDKESQVAVGEGLMLARKMFEALVATKYKGFVDSCWQVWAIRAKANGEATRINHRFRPTLELS